MKKMKQEIKEKEKFEEEKEFCPKHRGAICTGCGMCKLTADRLDKLNKSKDE